ncbi:MAG TPA: DNA methyltransferase [Nitrososphaerales archaeon]|nr:DNA methyltransferase [Nitrososphaerales archaeon]
MPELAGVHKIAPLMAVSENPSSGVARLVEGVAELLHDKMTLSVSNYGVDGDDYEGVVRALLDEVKRAGFRKAHLLRPDADELLSEQVQSRSALDIVVFPYHDGIGLGPTVWIPDSVSMRNRGTQKPTPHSDISMSPRLARVLLNLSGLTRGQTILDPFCGSGTILAEAFMRSMRCLGLDAKTNRVRDARENLGWLVGSVRDKGYDIRVGDAMELPRMLRGSKVDGIVSEPLLLPTIEARPRTRTAADLIGQAGEIYGDALASMAHVLRPGGRIVLVVPVIQTMEGEEVSLTLEGRALGLRLFQPGPIGFQYPVRLSFESTRWIRRAVYVFESISG